MKCVLHCANSPDNFSNKAKYPLCCVSFRKNSPVFTVFEMISLVIYMLIQDNAMGFKRERGKKKKRTDSNEKVNSNKYYTAATKVRCFVSMVVPS